MTSQRIPEEAIEAADTPQNCNSLPCDMCAGKHWSVDCPQWLPVPTNLADAKALFARNGVGIDVAEGDKQ